MRKLIVALCLTISLSCGIAASAAYIAPEDDAGQIMTPLVYSLPFIPAIS